jgi:murein DD-endopeptidase MepM/ murein hydrolase activator NlpD
MGAVLVLVLFAAYWLLTSAGMFPGEPGLLSRNASPERTELHSTSRTSAPAPFSPFDSVPLETASLSGEPRIRAARGGAEESIRTPGSEFAATRRPLLIPVAGVRPEDLVDTYTHARSEGRRHDAIDIMAPHGTLVLAAAEGTVLKLFQSEQGGITLYQLDPDQRTLYYYAHLDRYAPGIAEGMRLRQGDTVGYVGDTGNAGAGNYHLHFEISTTQDPAQYWGGTPTNPYPLLRGKAAPRQ